MSFIRLRWRWVLLLVLFCAGVGLFLLLGPPALLAKSESPAFCASCHVMQSQYDAWFHEGAHRRIRCVDCHLPFQNLFQHYLWKGIDGMRDLIVFHSGLTPERITISNHGQKTLQQNCVRCHSTTVARIDKDRQCWECHRRFIHLRSGAIMTAEEGAGQ